MKRINSREKVELIKKLKPFWKDYWKIYSNYSKKTRLLEKKMNASLKLKTELVFFYVDGECVGIGSDNYSDRAWFPLIHDSELY